MLQAAPKSIHIYLESNPNPNSLKFVVNEMLVPEGMSFDFPGPAEAEDAPLAQELFMYPFVERVFYMSNFVTVTKKEDVEWIEVQDTLKNHIRTFLESGKLILDKKEQAAPQQEETETIKKIKTVLTPKQAVKYEKMVNDTHKTGGSGWSDGWSAASTN